MLGISENQNIGVQAAGAPAPERALYDSAPVRELRSRRASLRRIGTLESSWSRLSGGLRTPMQHFDWTRACLETVEGIFEVALLSVNGEDGVVAAAPLVRQGARGSFGLVGVELLHEPMNLLYTDGPALSRLASRIADLKRPLVLRRLPMCDSELEVLRAAFRPTHAVIIREATPAPYIELDPSWKQPLERISSERRSHIRRMRRIAGELGEVDYEFLEPSAQHASELLAEAFRIEASSWKGDSGTALALDRTRGRFFRHYALSAARRNALRILFLRIGGVRVAMQLAIESDGALWLLKIGYHERYARCSPGTLLLAAAIGYAASRGLSRFEFLGAPETWTETWTKSAHRCFTFAAYPKNFEGIASFCADGVRFATLRASNWLRDGT